MATKAQQVQELNILYCDYKGRRIAMMSPCGNMQILSPILLDSEGRVVLKDWMSANFETEIPG